MVLCALLVGVRAARALRRRDSWDELPAPPWTLSTQPYSLPAHSCSAGPTWLVETDEAHPARARETAHLRGGPCGPRAPRPRREAESSRGGGADHCVAPGRRT